MTPATVSVMGALKERRTVEPAGYSVEAIGTGSEYRMPLSFAGSWTYTSYVLVRTGTLMLYRLVLWVRSPVGTAALPGKWEWLGGGHLQ